MKRPEASIAETIRGVYGWHQSRACDHVTKAYPSPDAKAGWSSRSIYRILANECYTGKIVQGKTRTVSYKNQARIQIPPEEWIRIAHVHEPIISEEMFFFVQEKKHRRFTE
ncbi:MAG: recombinase family protein [Lachnospiraceae bacterium]